MQIIEKKKVRQTVKTTDEIVFSSPGNKTFFFVCLFYHVFFLSFFNLLTTVYEYFCFMLFLIISCSSDYLSAEAIWLYLYIFTSLPPLMCSINLSWLL